MNKKEITLESKKIYQGKVINVYQDKALCPNGETSIREVVKHRGGVGIILELSDGFVLEKQYRYALEKEIIEIPAGKLEENEDIFESAKRELLEETGYRPLNMIFLGDIYPTAGYSSEVIHLYYCNEAVLETRHLDKDEVIDLIIVPLKTIDTLILENEIKDAKTIAAFALYKLFKEANKI